MTETSTTGREPDKPVKPTVIDVRAESAEISEDCQAGAGANAEEERSADRSSPDDAQAVQRGWNSRAWLRFVAPPVLALTIIGMAVWFGFQFSAALREQGQTLRQFSDSLEGFEGRFRQLQDDQGELAKRFDDVLAVQRGQKQAVSRLTERLDTLEEQSGISGAGGDLVDRQAHDRLDVIETAQTTLGQTVEDLQATLKTLSASLQADKGGGSGDARIIALQQAQHELTGQLHALQAELAAQKKALVTPALTQKEAKEASAGMSVVFSALSRRLAEGQSFASELERLQELIGPAPEITLLRSFASGGVMTRPALAEALNHLSENFVAASPMEAVRQEPDEQGFWAGVKGAVFSGVRIRKVGETDWANLIERAGTASQLENAVAMLDRASPPPAVAGWLRQAKDRLAADRAAERLSRRILEAIERLERDDRDSGS